MTTLLSISTSLTSKLNSVNYLTNTILRNAFSTMKLRKIEDAIWELIPVRYVLTSLAVLLIMNAHYQIVAPDHIIELKNFIIQRNIKSSFANLIPIKQKHVTMETCVHSHMPNLKFLLIFLISSRKTQISTFFILKRSGVLIVTQLMPEMPVFMLIIGRILEENHMYLNMRKSNAHNGRLKTSFKLMQMVVNTNIDASSHMVGKNKSIIHLTIKCMLVDKVTHARKIIVLTIIQKKIGVNRLIKTSNSSLRIEEAHCIKLRFISQSF